MSYSFVEDNDLLPSVFLIANAAVSNIGRTQNTDDADGRNYQYEVNDFEHRLQELLLQRTNLLQPLQSTISSSTISQIPTTEIIKFCSEYKENKKKLDQVASLVKILNDNKAKVDHSYNQVIENLQKLFDFVKTNEDCRSTYSDVINKITDLAAKSKESVCKNENQLLEEQAKLSNYISECIELFGIVDKEVSNNIPKNNDEKVSITCPVCYEHNVNSVYVPCGHTICNGCSTKVISNTCIICRKKAKVISFYLSG
jgi:septal ring factor EnvC (AmiA/AmiB activator)